MNRKKSSRKKRRKRLRSLKIIKKINNKRKSRSPKCLTRSKWTYNKRRGKKDLMGQKMTVRFMISYNVTKIKTSKLIASRSTKKMGRS